MNQWPDPFTEQRADPFVLRDSSYCYFTASVSEYDRLEIRRAGPLEGLRTAASVVVWCKPESGPMSQLIRAPEIHHLTGKWYIYFAATHTQSPSKLGTSQHCMFALQRTDADPPTGQWTEKNQIKTQFDTLAFDATTFNHQGKQQYLWARKSSDITGNSNIYFAELEGPQTIEGGPVMLNHPRYDQECRGSWVNEGPVVMVHGDKLFTNHSTSAIDKNYCMGLLWTNLNADPLKPQNWHKSPHLVFTTSYEDHQLGPGHNSFIQMPEGGGVPVYRAGNHIEIEGDPLYNPSRRTRLKLVRQDKDGMPDFGVPPADTD